MTSRPWTRAERRVVLRGSLGRLTIALEPLIVGLLLASLPIALLVQGQELAHLVAPIFAFGAFAFIAYAIVLITPPIRAVVGTYSPIHTVKGYLRYHEHRPTPESPPEYVVAVLDSEQKVLGEWPMQDFRAAQSEDRTLVAATVEFSRYGGIHKIDGQSTGVLPDEISPLGIGIERHAERHAVQL
jgi:hypothetical protein